jgi:succinoglycan biosynthesis transport protein ExoP
MVSVEMSENRPTLRALRASDHGASAPSEAPLHSYEEGAQEAGGRHMWRRYASAVLRYKWLVIAITVAGTGCGFYAARLVRPEYVAQVMFWVEASDGSERGPIRNTELLRSAAWVDLLKAYTVLDYTVREERLFLHFATPRDSVLFRTFDLKENVHPGAYKLTVDTSGRTFTLATKGGITLQRGAVGDSVGPALGFIWVPSRAEITRGSNIEFSVAQPRDASRELADRLTTTMAERGNFLRLELRGAEPVRITTTLNTIAKRYVSLAADLKQQKLKELAKILDEQLVSASANLHNAELALESFRVRTVTLPSQAGGSTPVTPGLESTRDPAFANFFNMKIEREALRRDRQAIERAIAQAKDSALVVEALDVVPAVKNSTELSQALQERTTKRMELRALRTRYTDQHAQVKQAMTQIEALEQRTVPRLVGELVKELATREAKLEAMVTAASGELREMPMRANEEARLRREVSISEQLYTTLQARYEEARLAAAGNVPDVRVLDSAAVPQEPVNDTRTRILLGAFLGSIGLGVVVSLLLDRWDSRVRYPEQVTQGMGLPILGAVPQTALKGRNAPEDITQVLESFRELRLNLRNAIGTSPLIVTVTSPGPGDGKTFTASNLALTFAEEGQRTLLIDGDIRRGGQHRVFSRPRKPGLTDYLAGSVNREAVILETSKPGLHLITCGTRTQDGPKLLGSTTMVDLIAYARAHYDVLILDSPPLGAGIDPVILGTLASNLLLVLRTGVTDRALTEAKLELLDRQPVRIVGAVLNAVPKQIAYGYYAYTAGYEATNEDGVSAGAAMSAS